MVVLPYRKTSTSSTLLLPHFLLFQNSTLAFCSNEHSSTAAGAKKVADNLNGANFSCKISPWLAMGCLSPRRMYEDLAASGGARAITASAAQKSPSDDSNGLSWLTFELLWRDFFR
jgi:hypothetical protein